ncbi:response regulator transcription factor [Streptomyces sp. NPDC004436]
MSVARYGQPLAPREIEFLQLTSQGFSYVESARRVRPQVSENTAKAHMQHVLTKLGASNAAHAVLLGCRAGILDGRPQRHGDHAGYEAHLRRGEDPKQCEHGCWAGERAYRNAQRARERATGRLSRPNGATAPPSPPDPATARQTPAHAPRAGSHPDAA